MLLLNECLCTRIFCYRHSPETFGYTQVSSWLLKRCLLTNSAQWNYHIHFEDGGSMDLRNVDILPQHYTTSQPWRPRNFAAVKTLKLLLCWPYTYKKGFLIVTTLFSWAVFQTGAAILILTGAHAHWVTVYKTVFGKRKFTVAELQFVHI
jgi:hypothetical protein